MALGACRQTRFLGAIVEQKLWVGESDTVHVAVKSLGSGF